MRLQQQSVLGGVFGTLNNLPGFRSESSTLRERSDVRCVLLTMAVQSADILASASRACGIELPVAPGAVQSMIVVRRAIWLTPRSWLICCESESDLIADVEAAFPDKLVHATLFTDALCWLELWGPAALDLLTEGGFVSLERGGLPVGHAKRTLIAQVAVVVIRESVDTWLLGVERSRAGYFVQWLNGAAQGRD